MAHSTDLESSKMEGRVEGKEGKEGREREGGRKERVSLHKMTLVLAMLTHFSSHNTTQRQGSLTVEVSHGLVNQCHLQTSITFCTLGWPVAGTLVLRQENNDSGEGGREGVREGGRGTKITHKSSLCEVCCHDNGVSVIFPDHPPKVFNS